MKLPKDIRTKDDIYSASLVWTRRSDGHQVARLNGSAVGMGVWLFDVHPTGSCVTQREGVASGTLHPSVTDALRTLGWRAAR